MQALFKVTVRQKKNSNGMVFTSENVLASSAGEAIKKTDAEMKRTYKNESLFVSDVVMLGVVTL